jgi:hypothetical protein
MLSLANIDKAIKTNVFILAKYRCKTAINRLNTFLAQMNTWVISLSSTFKHRDTEL